MRRAAAAPLAADQLANHLVDRGRMGDGAAALDRGGDLVRVLGVHGVRAVDEDDVRAEALGFADLGEGVDAERLGLVAGGDQRAGIGHGAADAERFAAVFGVDLLLDGREEAVEIDVQEAETVGLDSAPVPTRSIIFARCSPAWSIEAGPPQGRSSLARRDEGRWQDGWSPESGAVKGGGAERVSRPAGPCCRVSCIPGNSLVPNASECLAFDAGSIRGHFARCRRRVVFKDVHLSRHVRNA